MDVGRLSETGSFRFVLLAHPTNAKGLINENKSEVYCTMMRIGRTQHDYTGVLTKICNMLCGYGTKHFQLLCTSLLIAKEMFKLWFWPGNAGKVQYVMNNKAA